MKLLKNSVFQGFIQALLTVSYVALVAWVMTNGNRMFGAPSGIMGPLAVLLLLVISATMVGSLIFGRSIIWYLDGKKGEALNLFGLTLGWLLILTIIVFILIATVFRTNYYI